MSLMSGLYVGTSGLQTSQNALNTTAHNLSNVETKGYVRQQVLMQDKSYNNIGMASVSKLQTGIGVEYAQVRQVRDYFLDMSYRRESGRSAFYQVCQESTSEIETLLGEFDGVQFQNSLEGLWTSIQELQKDPTSAVTQGSLVNTATQFLERAQAVYNGLSSYQDTLNSRVQGYVNRINEIGNTILDLNDRIQKEEVGESEANDLRDQRNALVDELSSLVNMTYSTNADGGIEVMIEGSLFVSRDRVFEMGTTVDEGTGFYTPVWPEDNDAPVFDVMQEISTDYNTDIGQLKSIILARGDRRANYTDLTSTYVENGETKTLYDNGYKEGDTQFMATSSSIIMTVQAELDNMVHSIVTEINNILTGEKETIDNGGDPSYSSLSKIAQELFVRLGTSRYEEDPGTSTYKYVEENASSTSHADIDTLYSISNLKINPELSKTPTKLGNGFLTEDKQANRQMADALAETFSKEFSSLNPNLTKEYNYHDYYTAMVGQVATTGSVYDSIVSSQEIATQQLDDSRQAVMGVSSSEELTNMIKYQNAYNAASRYITACNDMLENLLTNLG